MGRTLVTHARVLTMLPGAPVVDDVTLVVDGAQVAAILPEPEARDAHAEILDAGGGLVFPGFINAHTHAYSALARGLPTTGRPVDFISVLESFWWRLDAVLELDDVRWSAALAARDGLRHGVTTVFDHHASFGAIDGALDAVADGFEAAGQRAVVCFETSDRAGREAAQAVLRETERFAAAQPRRPCVAGVMLGLHAAFTLSDATLAAAADVVAATGLAVHVHMAEDLIDRVPGTGTGSGTVERLRNFGLLPAGSIAAHALHLDVAERRTLGANGVVVAHNPRSNMQNGVGRCDLGAMAAAGVQVGLGTDGFGGGMLAEARVATLGQRQAPRLGDGSCVQQCLLDANAELASLYIPGAGRLVPGAPADFVVTRYVPPTPLLAENFWGHLLFGDVEAQVRAVFVGGERVIDAGRSTRLDDAELEAACREHARAVWDRFERTPPIAWKRA